MTEDEAMKRLRAAWGKVYAFPPAGGDDTFRHNNAAALLALRDADKPLSEIVPVDPDLIAARNVVSAHWLALDCLSNAEDARRGEDDGLAIVQCALAGIRAGKAMQS